MSRKTREIAIRYLFLSAFQKNRLEGFMSDTLVDYVTMSSIVIFLFWLISILIDFSKVNILFCVFDVAHSTCG